MLFLNHAATSPLSPQVTQSIAECAKKFQRPLSEHFYEQLSLIESTRAMLASLLGASAGEIAFCNNTSTALSLIAHSISWKEGDVVLAPSDEFNSNLFVWQNLRDRGVRLKTFRPKPGEPIDKTLAQQDLKGVRLISISAVSYQSGRLYELQAFSRFCQERSILSCLDAIQAAGSVPLHLRSLGVDFAAFGAQKWLLGPIGCGFFYAKKELHSTLYTPFVGWTSAQYSERLYLRDLDLSDELTRYEPGLPNIFPIAGLHTALTTLGQIGYEKVFQAIEQNRLYLESALDTLAPMRCGSDKAAGICSFFLTENQAQLLEKAFKEKAIVATVRELTADQTGSTYTHFLRFSPHYYHTEKELELAMQCVQTTLNTPKHFSPLCKPKKSPRQDPDTKRSVALIGYLPTCQEDLEGSLSGSIAKELITAGFSVVFVGSSSKREQIHSSLLGEKQHQSRFITTDLFEPSSKQDFHELISTIGEVDHYLFCLHQPLIERSELLDEKALANLWHLHVGFFQSFSIALLQRGFPKKVNLCLLMQSLYLTPLPFCSAYHSTWQALYTYATSIAIEWHNKIGVLLYVVPPTHSKLQKRRGRSLLRFFKLGKGFAHFSTTQKEAARIVSDLKGKNPKGIFPMKDRLFIAFCYLFPKKMHKWILEKMHHFTS